MVTKTERPWGYYEVLDEYPEYWKIKKLVISPHHCISFQRHTGRKEVWLVMSGKGSVIVEDFTYDQIHGWAVGPGDLINVQREAWHQLINGNEEPLVIHELQLGHCDEADTERK